MRIVIKLWNYLILILILAVAIIGILSFQNHISFEESSEKLNKNKTLFTEIANEFLKQSEIKAIFRRDIRRLPFGFPLSWFKNYDITYIISTSNSVFEIKIEDDFKDKEKEYWNHNFNNIKYNGKYFDNFILDNKINKQFLKSLIFFILDYKIYKISKFMDNKTLIISLERDEGLIYIQNIDSIELRDFNFGYTLSQIDSNWFFIKDKLK